MAFYALTYDVVDDFANRRMPFRPLHLQHIRDAHEKSGLLLGGALGDPPDRALIIFQGSDSSSAEDFAKRDPYVLQGLVRKWEVRPWNVVIGQDVFDTRKAV
jgi:uncharacterized protein YciI